jgi:hypothetical protein
MPYQIYAVRAGAQVRGLVGNEGIAAARSWFPTAMRTAAPAGTDIDANHAVGGSGHDVVVVGMPGACLMWIMPPP